MTSVWLARKHPQTGQTESRCYYVMEGRRWLGRVRFNDGWNASVIDEEGYLCTMAGTWRSRFAAVEGVLDAHIDGSEARQP